MSEAVRDTADERREAAWTYLQDCDWTDRELFDQAYSAGAAAEAEKWANAEGHRGQALNMCVAAAEQIGASKERARLAAVIRSHGYDVLATGHNLDDEAAVLFGNVLQWSVDFLARQRPVLPAGGGFVRRVKPLVRIAERETAD